MDCSNTAKCMDRGDMEGQVECADKCVEEFRERVALVDFPTGNQLTFGQARDFAR